MGVGRGLGAPERPPALRKRASGAVVAVGWVGSIYYKGRYIYNIYAMAPSLFDKNGRLKSDAGAVDERDLTNRVASAYVMTNLRPRPDQSLSLLGDMRSKYVNLQSWDGYGWNVALVDADSSMRLSGVVTRERSKVVEAVGLECQFFHAITGDSGGVCVISLQVCEPALDKIIVRVELVDKPVILDFCEFFYYYIT